MAQKFITDLYLVTKDTQGVITLETTTTGGDGNLWESSWRHKAKRVIGYSCNDDDEYIVTDIKIFPEDRDKDIPEDYAGIIITKDTKEKALKKHTLCFLRESREKASKGVDQIQLVNQSKGELVPAQFTALEFAVNEILIVFKTSDITKHQQIQQRTSAGLKLNIQQDPHIFAPVSPPVSSGLDGIPFLINPKYDSKTITNDPVISGISVISLEDLLRKYNYSFETEKKVMEKL